MVRLYKTERCEWCVQVKKFLDYKKVAYEEIQLEDNPELAQEFYSRGYVTIPIVTNGDKITAGYSVPKLLELLNG